MTETLPRSRVIHVELQIALPAAATHDEVMEWVRYSVGHNGSINDANPLYDHELTVIVEPVLTDAGHCSWVEIVSTSPVERGMSIKSRRVSSLEPAPADAAITSSEAAFRAATRKVGTR